MEKVVISVLLLAVSVHAVGMPGGWSDVEDLNSIQDVAKNATRLLTTKTNSMYHLKLLKIVKARKQVVAGMNYKIEGEISPTECKSAENLSNEAIEECPLQKCDKPNYCTLTAWSRPWIQEEEGFQLTNFNCDSERFCDNKQTSE